MNQHAAGSHQEIATFPVESEQFGNQHPTRSVDIGEQPSPNTPLQISTTGTDSSAAIKDLLHRFACRNPNEEAPQWRDLAEPEERIANRIRAVTTIPLDYRSSARRIAITTDRQEFETSLSAQNAGEDPGRIIALKRRLSSPTPIQDSLPDSRIENGVLTNPVLRIVARNDKPAALGFRNLPKPDLQIIELDSVPAALQSSEDLIARLSGSWENSFIAADEDAADGGQV